MNEEYLKGIRRGRAIERQTHRPSIVLSAMIGFAFGLVLSILIGIIATIIA